MSKPKRIGARSFAALNSKILRQLNLGEIESASLTEAMAIDFPMLLKNHKIALDKKSAAEFSNLGIIAKMRAAAGFVDDWQKFSAAKSDTIRGISCFALANNSNFSFAEKLEKMKILASDSHFGVREWAWLSMRNLVIENLDEALAQLALWTSSKDEGLRRFASEITRPRGVWCAHILVLKTNPSLGAEILNSLKSDPSRYVQNSVANWLNDASKSDPIWVKNLLKNWNKISTSAATIYITKRALRTLNKKNV